MSTPTQVPAQLTTGLALENHIHDVATTTTDGFLSKTDKSKLDGMQPGATAYEHPATHPASMIVPDANHEFVTDSQIATWNAKQSALGFTPENQANKNINGGYAGLDSNGKIASSAIPSLAITDTFTADSDAAMLALSTAQKGDVCIRTDINKNYILTADPYSVLTNWVALAAPPDAVTSVAGKTGVVALIKDDVGLSNVDNTSDLNKPISTATQSALDNKIPTSRTVNAKALSSDIVLTTADITDSTNKRYVTDAQITLLGNTSGINSGNETTTTVGTLLNGATAKTTPVDADIVPLGDSTASYILKKLTWANIKATLKTYFDTLYNYYTHPANHPASMITTDATHEFVTDSQISTWNAKQDALGFTPENVANKNISGGYAGLDSNGKLLDSVIPSLAITNTFTATSDATMIALSGAQKGDVCVRTDVSKTYILSTEPYSTLANWTQLATPTDTVLSVNSKTGVVVLTATDIGLGNVDNTSDLNKPISTATQTALDNKAPATHVGAGGITQHPVATGTVPGFMGTTDRTKLDALLNTVINTTTQWNTLNPILSKGTICIEDKGTGYFSIKIADGTNTWKLLPSLVVSDNPVKSASGTLAAGAVTITLPFQYDITQQNVLVFLGSIKQRASILTYTNSTTITLPTSLPYDTEYEVICFPLSISAAALVTPQYNYIIDGAFDFWYEGTTQSTTGYGSDTMWRNDHIGSTKVHSQQAFAVGELFPDGVPCPTYYSRTVVTSVVGTGNCVYKRHVIEGVRNLAGKTVTLSFYAKADAAKNISLELTQNFGSGGSPSATVTGIGSQKIVLTTTWTKYTVTVTLPSVSGKTIGTDLNSSLTALLFWFDAGSSFDSRTVILGQQAGTFDIALVKLEEGTTTTPYVRDVGSEEIRLNRYYEKINNLMGYAYNIASTNMVWSWFFKVKKRSITALSVTYASITYSNMSTLGTNSVDDTRLQFWATTTANGTGWCNSTVTIDCRL